MAVLCPQFYFEDVKITAVLTEREEYFITYCIVKYIEEINPFLVGVRVLTGPPIPRAIEVSKIAKSLNKIVVWGGPHPTILPEQTLQNPNIDSVVIGEGEHTFQKLLN